MTSAMYNSNAFLSQSPSVSHGAFSTGSRLCCASFDISPQNSEGMLKGCVNAVQFLLNALLKSHTAPLQGKAWKKQINVQCPMTVVMKCKSSKML